MTSTYTPATEVALALVALFKGDTTWSNASTVGSHGGLLFPVWAPRTHLADDRVYSNKTELPKETLVLQALPRVLLDVNWSPHGFEQEQAGTLHGPVTVWLHVLVPREHEMYGEQLTAAAVLLLQSTRLSSARIIAADLTSTSDVVKDRVAAFNGAFEWLAGFRSPNVGVLV